MERWLAGDREQWPDRTGDGGRSSARASGSAGSIPTAHLRRFYTAEASAVLELPTQSPRRRLVADRKTGHVNAAWLSRYPERCRLARFHWAAAAARRLCCIDDRRLRASTGQRRGRTHGPDE